MLSKEEAEQKAQALLQQAQQESNQKLASKARNIPRRFKIKELKPIPPHDQVRLFEKAKALTADHPLYKRMNYFFIVGAIFLIAIFIKKMNFFVQYDEYNIVLYFALGAFVVFNLFRDRLIKNYPLDLIQDYHAHQQR